MPDPRNRPRLQRAIVLSSVFLLALVASLSVGLDRQGTTARAALPDGPFRCGANDENRQPVTMWAGSMTADGALPSMNPCLSGVKTTLTIPSQSGAAKISSIRKLDAQNNISMKTASGETIPNVYHLGFKGFTINSTARGVNLRTTGGAATPHTLTLAHDAGAIFGGGDVITDLLVTGTSTIVIDPMPAMFLGSCGMLGGTPSWAFLDGPCTVQVANISPDMVEFANAIGISTLTIRQMTLEIYYLVTHTATGGVPGGAALQMPNTTITVGGS